MALLSRRREPGTFPRSLRCLLVFDIFTRIGEGLVDVFLVIFATSIAGVSMPQYGVLIAVQMITAIVVYLPAARIADRVGRKPFVIATLIAFTLFPLAVISARTFPALVGAFIVGGLREIGEPSRKALIVDFAQPAILARTIGSTNADGAIAELRMKQYSGDAWQRRSPLPQQITASRGFRRRVDFRRNGSGRRRGLSV